MNRPVVTGLGPRPGAGSLRQDGSPQAGAEEKQVWAGGRLRSLSGGKAEFLMKKKIGSLRRIDKSIYS